MTRPMEDVSRDRPRIRGGTSSRDRSVSKGGLRRDKQQEVEVGPPGAGTLFVHGIDKVDIYRDSSRSPIRKRISKERERRSTRSLTNDWEELSKYRDEPIRCKSPDKLLFKGIDGYTFTPASQGGVLGKGKFSTVYRVTDPDGIDFAVKHTPLHPHHPLIAARLLREPTLLASLPTHPCLIGVYGSIRTTGHFYLIEQYAHHHIPLSSHPTPLRPSRAAYILDQLVSVVRDCLHSGGRVVHRDLKGENILIDVDTGDLLLLDLGLGTQYSASEPKLTTCCGSPAFHSPEVVTALNHPPGEISYYGPELDIWCIALTLLSLLLGIRFPIGSSHKSLHVMRDRVLDRLQELDELYPPTTPWVRYCHTSDLTPEERITELNDWRRVRKALRDFLDINGIRRMASFAAYPLSQKVQDRVDNHVYESGFSAPFRDLSFIPQDVKYTLPIHLDKDTPIEYGPSSISLSNPTGLSQRKVLSYLKYIFRSRGILYHCVSKKPHFLDAQADIDIGPIILQLILPFPSSVGILQSALDPPDRGNRKRDSWVSSLFPSTPKRASSLPPQVIRQQSPSGLEGKENERKSGEWFLSCYIKIDIEKPINRLSGIRTPLRGSSSDSMATPFTPVSPISASSIPLPTLTPLSLQVVKEGVQEVSCPAQPSSPLLSLSASPRARSVDSRVLVSNAAIQRPANSRTSSTSRIPRLPHPLSRQVSVESKSSRQGATHSSSCQSKVVITISDPRGMDILKQFLDVKYDKGVGDSPVSTVSSTLIDTNEVTTGSHDGHPGAVLKASQRLADKNEGQEHECEETRGRPRSKEDSKVIIMAHATKPVVTPVPPPRQVSRGRKKRFLEGWFGIGGPIEEEAGNDRMRSVSTPPSTTPNVATGTWLGVSAGRVR